MKKRAPRQESDPDGYSPHTVGAKLDAGKLYAALVLDGFARALERVCLVGTVGADKYTKGGWEKVPDGIARYRDAKERHKLKGGYEEFDKDLSFLAGQPVEHLAAEIWNGLAVLELKLRTLGDKTDEQVPVSGAIDHESCCGPRRSKGTARKTCGQNGRKVRR